MSTSQVGTAIEQALGAAGLSQRALAERTGISQSTLSRVITGERLAKMPELIKIAEATGYTIGQLAGTATADRMQCTARATNGSTMDEMREQLLHFMEIDAYLDDQAIPATQ